MSNGSSTDFTQLTFQSEGHLNPETGEPSAFVHPLNPPSPADSQQTEVVAPQRRNSNEFTDSLSAIRHQLERSVVPDLLLHLPTMLVEYYFNYVCQIFSSFDGTLNPFRSTVGRLWDGSAPIYYAIQSMAAGYLSNHFPRMSQVGKQMQRETYKCLYQIQPGKENDDLDKTLLTVLLVGQTTAWHDSKDLGLVHLRTAKRLNRKRLQQQRLLGNVDGRISRQNAFFEQCILYWDMLGGFVNDDSDDINTQHSSHPIETPSLDQQASSGGRIFPHPWTGVAPTVPELLAKVGRLIRKYRKQLAQEAASLSCLSSSLDFTGNLLPHELLSSMEAMEQAQALEIALLTTELPEIESLVDAGDENTPVKQYIDLADSYRAAGLLQIYKVFPSILLQRLSSASSSTVSTSPSDSQGQLRSDPNQLFRLLPVPPTNSPDDFIVSLALHIINLLERLPPNSGTRCLQPLILMSAASELRFPVTSDPFLLESSIPATNLDGFNPSANFVSLPDLSIDSFPVLTDPSSTSDFGQASMFDSISAKELDIASARKFALTRLQEFQLSLPAKPILQAEMIIKETWTKWDADEIGVYWMDVMDARGWGSIFG